MIFVLQKGLEMKPVKPLTRKNQGFTLIEALIAAMLIGLAIAALVSSSGAFTMYNAAGLDLSTSEFLIEEIRELTSPVAFTGLMAYNNQNYTTPNGPVDAGGNVMPEFAAYSQHVTVQYANPANLAQQPYTTPSAFRRITVTITKGGQTITSTSWIRAEY
jgi:prepilin-type N-terminal cleavage/methylation domain-containing protein